MAKKRVYWQGPEREPDASVIEATDKLCDEVGMMFRHAQWEAYETYCAWEAEQLARSIQTYIWEVEIDEQDDWERESADFALMAGERRLAGAAGVETPGKMSSDPVGTFKVEGVRYTALSDTNGNIFLYPAPGSDITHLVLRKGSEENAYVLSDKEEAYRQVIGLTIGELEYFLVFRTTEKDRYRIGFKKR